LTHDSINTYDEIEDATMTNGRGGIIVMLICSAV
jgi:hypothetical protein